MRSLKLKIVAIATFAILDCFITTLLLIHGNQWGLFVISLQEFSFSSSFVDICIFTYIRNSVIIGGATGVFYNPSQGSLRCRKSIRAIVLLVFTNGYYLCAKLIAFSEDNSFQAGPKLNWFFALFGWCIIGSILSVLLWYILSVLLSNSKSSNECDAHKNDSISEEEPLLKHHDKPSLSGDNAINNIAVDYGSFSDSKTQNGNKNKGDDDEDEKSLGELANKANLKAVFSYSIPDWKLLLCGIFFLVGASIAQIFLPLYTGKVVAGIVASQDKVQFTKDIIIMGLISLAASICSGLRAGFFMNVIQRFNIRVRDALFGSLLSQEIGFYDSVKTGDITSRLTSDTSTMSDTVGLNCNIFIRNFIQAIGTCVFMFSLSWRLSVITFMGFPLVFGVSELYGHYYKKLQELVQDRFARANEVAEEVCSSMQTVRSFANEKGETERYHNKLIDVYKVQLKQAVSYAGYIWSTQSIELLLTVLTLWFGGSLLAKGALSAQNFISFILYQESLSQCMGEIGEVYTGLMQALGAAEKVFQLIQRKPKISIDDGCEKPDNAKGHISFKNVSFSYPTRPDQPVLKDVSFEVKPGEVVALVGPSGGGKSSCVKLLQRFYDPDNGTVLLDGKSVKCYDHQFLHEKMSMVGQEPVLYARSVHDNIAYGLDQSQYTNEDVIKASVKANAHNFVMEMNKQYETEVGEKGTQLSGGQKQRVAIARALLRNPCVLVLDEATSALDTESEALVQEALQRSKSNRTVLLIAHRLSTVEQADRIVVIVKGMVEEMGSHKQLMEKQGTYYRLVRRQLASHSNLNSVLLNNTEGCTFLPEENRYPSELCNDFSSSPALPGLFNNSPKIHETFSSSLSSNESQNRSKHGSNF
ncbi:ABC-type oligopeptide transporter ABCB9-like isoform X2 [Clavelina lepadiformis]|uniref:ABC-type oligopeptide transporter ABCB9-like isoform X2 n=1 Tax=Clavelina lepadiformis TaxID=159417 RepID=UPI0040430C3F